MKFTLLTIIVAILACQSLGKVLKYNPRLDGRIVGGEDATIEEFPYQISLEYYGSHRCGGSIINSTVILTAAHCTDGFPTSYLKIRAGTPNKGSGGVVIQVKKVLSHSKYNSHIIDYDVALLILSEPLIFSDKIQPIALPNEDEYLDEPEMSVTTGWGALHSGGSSPSILQKVVLPIVAQDTCVEAYKYPTVTPRMICAGYMGVGGKGTCQGDSGGPLVSNGKVHGITSWAQGCAQKKYPSVLTRVTAIRGWIRDQVNL